MTETVNKPPKANLQFDISDWSHLINEFEARANRHTRLAQQLAWGLASTILVGFFVFVLAGTIAAWDTVDYYTDIQTIKVSASNAQAMLEKIHNSGKDAESAAQLQTALGRLAFVVDSTTKLEQNYHPDSKELEQTRQRHLISTVTTRISAASLLAFLAALLANLYRHNVRLSAYYSSRLDALRLSKSTGLAAFERLSKSLLPDGLEPGKGPDTPAKQALEFAKAITKAAGSESKIAKRSA